MTSSVEVVNPVLDEINELIAQVESFYFEFAKGKSEIDASQQAFTSLTQDIQSLITKSIAYGKPAYIDVVGFTDASGTAQVNRIIGTERANQVTQKLIENGVPAQHLRPHNSQEYESTTVTSIGDRRETRLLVKLGGAD
jgi:outer membrane protein OmpA-like peptidoglycan-associated protein